MSKINNNRWLFKWAKQRNALQIRLALLLSLRLLRCPTRKVRVSQETPFSRYHYQWREVSLRPISSLNPRWCTKIYNKLNKSCNTKRWWWKLSNTKMPFTLNNKKESKSNKTSLESRTKKLYNLGYTSSQLTQESDITMISERPHMMPTTPNSASGFSLSKR